MNDQINNSIENDYIDMYGGVFSNPFTYKSKRKQVILERERQERRKQRVNEAIDQMKALSPTMVRHRIHDSERHNQLRSHGHERVSHAHVPGQVGNVVYQPSLSTNHTSHLSSTPTPVYAISHIPRSNSNVFRNYEEVLGHAHVSGHPSDYTAIPSGFFQNYDAVSPHGPYMKPNSLYTPSIPPPHYATLQNRTSTPASTNYSILNRTGQTPRQMTIPSEYANRVTSNKPHAYSVLTRKSEPIYEQVHNKYIKYKTKYIELKRLIESSNV